MPLLPVFDRLLDPQDAKTERRRAPPAPPPPRRPRAIPALYATPEATPLPETPTPSSFPPSPYVINHKRRRPRLLKSFSQSDVGEGGGDDATTAEACLHGSKSFSEGDVAGIGVDVAVAVAVTVAISNGVGGDKAEAEREVEGPTAAKEEAEGGGEGDDFFDPKDSMSVASSTGNAEGEEWSGRWKGAAPLPVVEFYDAFEEISSESALQSPAHNTEADLRDMRLSLLIEIEKRKQAEEALLNMQNQWQRLSYQLSLVGIKLPALPTMMEEGSGGSSIDPAEELQQQIIIARLVAESIGRGSARADVEMEMESQIKAKNFEISRLHDRLRYYEAANHEMSQRNQEAVERARRQRQRRKRRQRWVWGSLGLAITIGAAAAAWSHFRIASLPDSTEGSGSDHHN